jgi:hypothetical protein
MSAEDEPVVTAESALEEESVAEGSLALNQPLPRGTCWYERNCKGRILAENVTARECGTRRLAGKSWRRTMPPGSPARSRAALDLRVALRPRADQSIVRLPFEG